MFNAVWWYAGWRRRLLRPGSDYPLVRKVLNSYLMGPVASGIGLVVSSFAPVVSLIIFLLIPMGYLFEGLVAKVDAGYISSGD